MAGALRLEGYCRELERVLSRGHRPDPSAVRTALRQYPTVIHDGVSQGYLPHRPSGPAGEALPS